MHLFSSDDIIRHILFLIFLSYPLLSSLILYFPFYPHIPLLSIIFLFYPPSSSPSLDDMSQGRREAFDVFRSEYAHNAVIEENKKTLKQR